MEKPFDLIIIGAGSAGLTAAEFAAKLGARVALVERGKIGGDCTWSGCVPSKALLTTAKMVHTANKAKVYGAHLESVPIDMKKVRDYLKETIGKIYEQELAHLQEFPEIELVHGWARFLDSHTIRIGERKLEGRAFLLATGAQPNPPQVPGYFEAPCLTYEQFFDNEFLPKRLVVLGAGATGMEMAQAYGRLGAAVTIVDVSLLPTLDPQVGQVMEGVFKREGINFISGMATSISYESGQFSITLDGDVCQTITADLLLSATGRRPNVDGMDLGKAGVIFDDGGIQVDTQLRTSARNIYAAGDCTGGFQTTHYAGWQGYKAVRNILIPGSVPGVSRLVPLAIFTDPEIAHVGLSEAAAQVEHDDRVHAAHLSLDKIDRAVIENNLDGFVKIVYQNNGKLLGATIVAPNAGELLAEYVLAINHGLSVRDLAESMHIYPTYSMGIQQLASDVSTEQYLKSAVGRIVSRFY